MVITKKRFAVNVLMNWGATAINMVVPFLLLPFVVNHLGAVQYAIWVLATATTSYLALLDLGLRSVIVRFVSKAHAQGQLEDATSAISSALWLRLAISGGVAILSVLLALATPHLFKKIEPDLMHAAQVTMLMSALGVSVTLISGVYGGVLTALSRFDLLSSITMSQTLFRAGGVLYILYSGHGLVTLAYWEFFVVFLAGLSTILLALKTFPASRTRARRPERSQLQVMWTYSLNTFIFMIAVQIILNTDSLVIGSFVSVGMVTFYSLGSSLVSYSSLVASAVSSTFVPIASGFEASGRPEQLRRMLLRGTQATLGLTLPIGLALIFRGETFINIWMGPTYGAEHAHISEMVLQILMVSLFFSMADATAGAIMMAIDKHGPVARWAIYEMLLNLGLSIFLVKAVGLYGVAWGTSIAITIVHLAFYPRYNRKILHVPAGTYIWEGWVKISLCSLPFGFLCWLTNHYWHASKMLPFFAQILAILPVYGVCVLILFRKEAQAWLASRRAPHDSVA